jgi:hypothetical protein
LAGYAVGGTAAVVVAGLGLVRLPDAYDRANAPATAAARGDLRAPRRTGAWRAVFGFGCAPANPARR